MGKTTKKNNNMQKNVLKISAGGNWEKSTSKKFKKSEETLPTIMEEEEVQQNEVNIDINTKETHDKEQKEVVFVQ